jgi:hypothetical protein
LPCLREKAKAWPRFGCVFTEPRPRVLLQAVHGSVSATWSRDARLRNAGCQSSTGQSGWSKTECHGCFDSVIREVWNHLGKVVPTPVLRPFSGRRTPDHVLGKSVFGTKEANGLRSSARQLEELSREECAGLGPLRHFRLGPLSSYSEAVAKTPQTPDRTGNPVRGFAFSGRLLFRSYPLDGTNHFSDPGKDRMRTIRKTCQARNPG